MQILQTTSSEVPPGVLAETELSAALHHLEQNMDGGGRPIAHLTTACFAALQSLEMLAPDENTPPAARLAQAKHVDEQVEACYERIGRWLLSATLPLETIPPELMRSSAQLFRNLSAIYAGEDSSVAAPLSERDPVLLMLRALWCLSMHAKWTYFMHQETDGSLWRVYHSLYERAESVDAARRAVAPYHDPDVGKLSCADVYVQSLLLGMLNAGNLSPQQIELAHRWVVAYVRDAGIASSDNGTGHVFHVCLDSERGLQSGTPPTDAPDGVRFIDIQPVCEKLMDSRESLRKGRIDLTDAGLQVAILDYGAFLDLAERFWSPSQNQVQERAPRVGMDQLPVEAIVGFDRVYEAAGGRLPIAAAQNLPVIPTGTSNVTFLYPETEQVVPPFHCTLKDRSASGVGLLVPGTSDTHIPATGALVAFRLSKADHWEAGVLVRRLAVPNADQTLLGIKRIAEKPVAVTLHRVADASAKNKNPVESSAIYAPKQGEERTWPDSLIVRDSAFSRNADFMVAAGRAAFLVRLTRVLDRGAGWVRAGFRVLSKNS